MLTQGFMQPLFLSATGGGDLNIKVYPDVSPNNDGQGNESLHIEGIEAYPENDIQIFNRWGNLIFKTHGYHNTDNSFKGKANTGILVDGAEVPDGTYYYILKVFDPVGAKTHIYNGFFVIKRK
jgi:gliding motility-associated-like protein